MQTAQNHTGRNELMECLRMVAAFFVICIHFPFPGKVGPFVSALGRFAVPMFFAVSGYYSFNIRAEKIAKRFWHLVKLNGIGILICLCYVTIRAYDNGNDILESWLALIPSIRSFGRWIFVHHNPFGGQYWYLTASAFCYAIFWLYVSFFGKDRVDYRPLYIVGIALFAVGMALEWVRLYVENISYYYSCNGWFEGIPMFCMGLFLREHQQRIAENFHLNTRKILFILLGATVLVVVQYFAYGDREQPLGAFVQTAALILLTQRFPVLSGKSRFLKRIISTFGFLSLSIYMLHTDFSSFFIYNEYILLPLRFLVGESTEAWLRPFIYYITCLLMGVVVLLALWCINRIRGKLKKSK